MSISWSKRLHESRGSGVASRTKLDLVKLRKRGWEVTEQEILAGGKKKVLVRYKNPDGKTIKSTKEVELQLRGDGIYEELCMEDEQEDEQQEEFELDCREEKGVQQQHEV